MRMGRMRGREKNRRRMKADAEQHQLRTTAAGEPDRAHIERRETILGEGKDRKNPHWRNGGVGKKLNGELLRLADNERRGMLGGEKEALKYPCALIASRDVGRKNKG